ncbi:MAG: transglycosylase SLT domain-containing protein [Rhizobiales bacterium]|nr:transglycosylase SLT domain-containing protein [Hyphomicrobiales bacterium]
MVPRSRSLLCPTIMMLALSGAVVAWASDGGPTVAVSTPVAGANAGGPAPSGEPVRASGALPAAAPAVPSDEKATSLPGLDGGASPSTGGAGGASLPGRRLAIGDPDYLPRLCDLIEREARAKGLPPSFFARLLWVESSFNPNVVSHKGAQGIAQFMPGTAALRGLADPFDPEQAIPASAALLADLKARFGNLGLAAAAYNSGEGRVSRWRQKQTFLPLETINYVVAITGIEAERWAAEDFAEPTPPAETSEAFQKDCRARKIRHLKGPGGGAGAAASAPRQPWGVQIAGDFSHAKAMRMFESVRKKHATIIGSRRPFLVSETNRSFGRKQRHNVVLGEATREGAEALCARLRKSGGFCVVVKN